MKKCFKGKVKYDFWLGTMSKPIVYNVLCFFLFAIVFCIILADEYFKHKDTPLFFLISVFSVAFIISIFYGIYFRSILKKWDKSGFEVLCVDANTHQITLDNKRSFSFAEIESLTFEKCQDALPGIPKSYTVINAQLTIKLINHEQIVYYVQKLGTIFKMHKFFKAHGLPSKADEFENSIFYRTQTKFGWIIFIIIVCMFVYAFMTSNQNFE